MVQDTSIIKDKIISFIKMNGPSLPVHIASRIETSILFTSAFLSELLAEKRLKMSNMRVGSSPLYFIDGQEPGLEKFAQHLRSKEKEAFLLLKDKKFLKDAVQQPAIRVALRDIRDFAIPFKKEDEIFWRFFTVSESELEIPKAKEQKPEVQEEIAKLKEETRVHEKPQETEKQDLGIFDDEPEKKVKKISKPKSSKKKKTSKKKSSTQNEKFFNEVKEFLSKNSIELRDIIHFSKKEFVLLVNESGKDKVLFAFDKKKVRDKEISKASKKARELSLHYIILSKSGVLKKIGDLIENLHNMDSVKSLDNS